jgi:hypothetical protein
MLLTQRDVLIAGLLGWCHSVPSGPSGTSPANRVRARAVASARQRSAPSRAIRSKAPSVRQMVRGLSTFERPATRARAATSTSTID